MGFVVVKYVIRLGYSYKLNVIWISQDPDHTTSYRCFMETVLAFLQLPQHTNLT